MLVADEASPSGHEFRRLASLLATASVGALVGSSTALPAGSLVGALLAVGGLQLLVGPIYQGIGERPGRAGLALIGAAAGTQIRSSFLEGLAHLIIPVVVIVGLLLAAALLLGWLLYRTGRMHPATAILGMSPGGAGEMSGSAARRGGDGMAVITLHLIRVILIVVLVPPLIGLLR